MCEISTPLFWMHAEVFLLINQPKKKSALGRKYILEKCSRKKKGRTSEKVSDNIQV